VVFIDDIDWADRATTDFLRHLLFRLEDEQVPLMIMTTSRADPHARAGDWVAKLRDEPRAAVLYLHPLNAMESAELARSLRPGTPIEKARELATASGGNPLLIEALSRYGGGDSMLGRLSEIGRAPEHPVTDAVRATLRSLSGDARSTISAAAVLAPECTRALLSEVTGVEHERLVRALHESTDAGVLIDDGLNVSFTHPLYSHIAYSLTLLVDRRALHAGAAAALERGRLRGESVVVRSIAHHVILAGPSSPVVLPEGRMRKAGDEALALGAWSEAARYFEAALTSRSLTAAESIEIHRLAGLSRRGNLQLPEAVEHFEAAIDLARQEADIATVVDLHIWRIRCAIGSREMLGVVSDRRDLEDLVDEIEEDHPQLAAEALVQVSQSFWVEWKIKRAGDAARRAMSIAERCGDLRAAAGAAGALTVPQWANYDLRGSLMTLEKGVAQARKSEDESALAGGPLFRLPLCGSAGWTRPRIRPSSVVPLPSGFSTPSSSDYRWRRCARSPPFGVSSTRSSTMPIAPC
jgi:tetratricopeptide (TPR) repeat protein